MLEVVEKPHHVRNPTRGLKVSHLIADVKLAGPNVLCVLQRSSTPNFILELKRQENPSRNRYKILPYHSISYTWPDRILEPTRIQRKGLIILGMEGQWVNPSGDRSVSGQPMMGVLSDCNAKYPEPYGHVQALA